MWRGLITHIKMSCHVKQNVTYVNESRIHMNESCHTWMSHVTHEWVMSHMNKSCHTWMSHVTHEWVMSHFNLVISHVWMRYATIQKTMRYLSTTYQDPGKDCWCPDSFTWMRILAHQQCCTVTRTRVTRNACEYIAQQSHAMHVCTSPRHQEEDPSTCYCVIVNSVYSHTRIKRRIPVLLTVWLCDCFSATADVLIPTWMSHVTHMSESWHSHQRVMPHTSMSLVACEQVMAHTWTCHVTCQDLMLLIWMRHVTHINLACRMWTSQYRTHECVVSHVKTSCEWVMLHTWMCHVTHINDSCHTQQ